MSNNQVKTSGDWMNLFLGQRGSRDTDMFSGTMRSSITSTSHYPSRYSPGGGDYSRNSSRYSPTAEYTGSRYSRDALGSDSIISTSVTSPTSYRRSYSYTNGSTYSRYLPQYRSRWTDPDEEEEGGHYTTSHYRSTRRSDTGNTQVQHQSPHRNNRQPENSREEVQGRTGDRNNNSEGSGRSKPSGRPRKAVVLNEGTIIIRRERAVSTSDEEEEESEVEEVNKSPSPPPRDPLEVEEEELTAKLQTAGFLLTLPEEEQAKRRLLEIKQIRENPDLFRPENSRGYKFSQLTEGIAKPSPARLEEEKILILRLQSRGISDVEQTDVQVRLQEIWRDRKDELDGGLGKLEQEYEHHLTESSTEISELEGSIQGKHSLITKLQEELMVLTMRKERIAADMEKVNSSHQDRMEALRSEMVELETKSSQYSVIKKKKQDESCLPEAERSELESELECPVCLEISRPPIYQCGEGHIVCSACKPLLRNCCICEGKYSDPPIRCRLAEKLAAKYFKDELES